ncbi:MAG TPA: DUF6600 domain-containing protein [Bryobacteraceae bacterium]|jgi:hypothetical protein
MSRRLLLTLLAAPVLVFLFEPVISAQFERAPSQSYPVPQYPPQEQQPSDGQNTAADEQHGVARLSVVQGDVNLKRGDSGQLEAAVINAPLVAADHVQTSPGSRAEVELDYGNLIRVGPNTDVGFADLQYHRYRLQLGAGTIIYRVLRDAGSQSEIDTPSIAVRPLTQGEFRISVLDDGTTQITVRSGQAEIDGPRGSERLDAGRTTLVRGDPSDPEFQETYEIGRDQLDDWSENRDRELLASQSYQHVSPDIPGADDLDTYGNWVPSEYGEVWAPRSPGADWSPYSQGQWTWGDYYGWTWVDSAPWGWAPYHYGRWFWNTGYGWCWWPGAVRARYAWSPALVGFFGWGSGGFSFGFGGIGWVPLAPFEVFHPWWGRGFYGAGRYGFRPYNFNLRNADIGRMYRNANIRGGALSAPYNGFGGPGQHFRAATHAQLTNATFFRGQMPVSPTARAFRFSNRQAIPNTRLAAVPNRFFQRPGYGRASGAQSQFGARPLQQRPVQHGIAPNMQGRFAGQGSAPAASQPRQSTGGWQRFGDPRNPGTSREDFTPRSEQGGGWHRFGQPQETVPGNGSSRPSFAAPARPRYNAPATQRYNAPAPSYRAPDVPRNSTPHYNPPRYNAPRNNAPSNAGHGGGRPSGGSGSPRGGGGSSSHGGGGGHSSGGHRGH